MHEVQYFGFGFASHCLKNWHKIFKPITEHSPGNCITIITFKSHLKIALKEFKVLGDQIQVDH